jgi:predicted nucleic acid-binding protein
MVQEKGQDEDLNLVKNKTGKENVPERRTKKKELTLVKALNNISSSLNGFSYEYARPSRNDQLLNINTHERNNRAKAIVTKINLKPKLRSSDSLHLDSARKTS